MKGDFTRLPFDEALGDTRVYLQQGRVQVDADWNTQADLIAHQLRTQARELIGPYGAPEADAGYKIEAEIDLYFDGEDDYIEVDDDPDLTIAGLKPFTIEFWCHPEDGPNRGGTILGQYNIILLDTEERGQFFVEIDREGHVVFNCYELPNGDQDLPEIRKYRTAKAIPFAKRTHIAITGDQTTLSIYCNGELRLQDDQRKAIVETRSRVLIGAHLKDSKPINFFHGSIEELRIWNTVLAPEKIQSAMKGKPKAGNRALLSYFPLTEGSGAIVNDHAKKNRKGRMGGGDANREPSWKRPNVRISAGCYYVNGLRCYNPTALSLHAQPGYTHDDFPAEDDHKAWLAYLDVWERLITHFEDPGLMEVALNGVDTAVRTRVVGQVKLLPIKSPSQKPEQMAEWRELHQRHAERAKIKVRYEHNFQDLGNHLYRVEIHCQGEIYHKDADQEGITLTDINHDAESVTVADASQIRQWRPGQVVEIFSNRDDDQPRTTKLFMVKAIKDDRVMLNDSPRDFIERDDPAIRAIAAFKWSRFNGAITYPVERIEAVQAGGGQAGVIHLEHTARHEEHLLKGAWVELLSRSTSLNGSSGTMLQIGQVNDPIRLPVKPAPPLSDEPSQLRLWNQTDREDVIGGLVVAHADDWIMLEKGVSLRFSDQGRLFPGDYWIIPARALGENGVEWPHDINRQPLEQPPKGVHHDYAPLAVITKSKRKGFEAKDLRTLFAPFGQETRSKAPPPVAEVEPETERTPPPTSAPQDPPPAPTVPATPFDLSNTSQSVPSGYGIFGQNDLPPEGFEYSGLSLDANPWTRTAAMPRDQSEAAAVVAAASSFGEIFVFLDNGEMWSFDPDQQQWRERPRLPEPRNGFGVVAYSGELFIIGGRNAAGDLTDTCLIYNPLENVFKDAAAMPTARADFAIALLAGRIHVIGGQAKNRLGLFTGISDAHEVYQPDADSWVETLDLPVCASSPVAAVIDDQIHVVGGEGRGLFGLSGGRLLDDHYIFDLEAGWTRGPDLPSARKDAAMVAVDDRLHLFGGTTSSSGIGDKACNDHLLFDRYSSSWQEVRPMPDPIAGAAAAGELGKIILIPNTRLMYLFVQRHQLYFHRRQDI